MEIDLEIDSLQLSRHRFVAMATAQALAPFVHTPLVSKGADWLAESTALSRVCRWSKPIWKKI